MKDTILSIIIPVYNTEKYLEECINSIISNDKSFEVLLIDDGSTDNSGHICDEFEKKDKRIKTIHKKNGGVSSARNLGIEMASGRYVMFVDSDDKLDHDWYQSLEYIRNSDFYIFDKRFGNDVSKENLLKFIIGYNKLNICIAGPFRKVIKRKIIINNHIKFNEKIINGEDMLFNLEILYVSKTYDIVPYNYYYYRQSIGQSTRSFNEKIIASDKMFHVLLNEILTKYNIDEGLKDELENYCKVNAIITIVNRLSYVKSYDDTKKYYSFLMDEPYKSIINDNNLILNKKKKLLFKEIKNKKFKNVFYKLRLKNKFSIYFKKIKNEELKKI